jgi:tryptophan halogenase
MKIVVIGGGTAGVMASTYFKSYWDELVEVVSIYDHSKPGIGVGESLTMMFDNYLRGVGVTTVELVKHCNATIKLGLKFKNWTKPDHWWFHNFHVNECISQLDSVSQNFNLVEAYDMATGTYDGGSGYNKFYFENNVIPDANNLLYRHALHVDATLVGRYIEGKFKDRIKTIDAIVESVEIENNNIKSIKLNTGEIITADLFVDCTGYQRALISQLNPEWIDISDQLPTDRTIPNPIFKHYDYIPPYTTAEATKNGWILDVPLSNRRGTGYVYSSKFMTDEEAKIDFNAWLLKNHNIELQSDRVIKFNNGYFKESWIGNCVAIGLASGFVEPLEATSLHHTYLQLDFMTKLNNFNPLPMDRRSYNKILQDIYKNSFEYIRHFYNTDRTDSEFWKYLTENKPEWLLELEEKMSTSYLNNFDSISTSDVKMFISTNFNCIAYGHGKYTNRENIKKYLTNKYLQKYAEQASQRNRQIKNSVHPNPVDHRQWVDSILNN